MKPFLPLAAVMLALTTSGAALANDDCHRPMAEWQSRDTVTARVTELGIATDRLRIDDGCYEIRGKDGDGNRVSLKIDPASLAILKLEVRFSPGADASRYLAAARGKSSGASMPSGEKSLRTPAPAAPMDTR